MEENYGVRWGIDKKVMKDMFKQISTTMTKVTIPEQKVHKLMTKIGGGWYMEKIAKGLPQLRIPKLSKK